MLQAHGRTYCWSRSGATGESVDTRQRANLLIHFGRAGRAIPVADQHGGFRQRRRHPLGALANLFAGATLNSHHTASLSTGTSYFRSRGEHLLCQSGDSAVKLDLSHCRPINYAGANRLLHKKARVFEYISPAFSSRKKRSNRHKLVIIT